MDLSFQEAFNILDLRKGASAEEVVNSYKRLALEWHPDKHNQSELSFNKFSKINNAFRRLTVADEVEHSKPLPKEKMFQIFEDVYIKKKTFAAKLTGHTIPSNTEKNKKKDDFIAAQLEKEKNNICLPPKVEDEKVATTDEEVEKNEANLSDEEEERRKTAEKRRAKKKRRKEAKKLEKEKISQQNKDVVPPTESNVTTSQFSRMLAENIDSGEIVNPGHYNKNNQESFISKDVKNAPEVKAETQEVDPLILQSRCLATRGNELASDENYIAAVEQYSEAIKINSKDFRFYGNRSYCFDKLGLFSKALADAEKAIKLNPEWSKNYHRKGRALAGLKQYVEAESLFETVLKMDNDCEEAKQELQRVRLEQLMDMGFTKLQAEVAIIQHKSVSAALDALLQAPKTRGGAAAPSSSDVYVSDDENQASPISTQKMQQPQLQLHRPILDIKLDPSNPERLKSLWVGNISKDVEEAALKRLFSPFGVVVSVKKKPDTYYAFVVFSDEASAGHAMRALQGVLFGGQKLYIRFPGKTATNSHPNNNPIVIKKGASNPPISDVPLSWLASSSGIPPLTKPKGPVNGNECYFWRTTGCSYGDNCKFKHAPENKGIDRKPWQTATA